MKKEIIGYKLKYEFEYLKEEAAIIGRYNSGFDIQKYGLPLGDLDTISRLKKAGILDLWFEKFYKEEPELEKQEEWLPVVNYEPEETYTIDIPKELKNKVKINWK